MSDRSVSGPRERPILFSAPMVLAILSGKKTQTRRLLRPQPVSNGSHYSRELGDIVCRNDYLPPSAMLLRVGRGKNACEVADCEEPWERFCPYGQVGDRLWVRETWQGWERVSYEADEWEPLTPDYLIGRGHSSIAEYVAERGHPHVEHAAGGKSVGPWRPSIHMPRWAARLLLEVTDVRVERLQDVGGHDVVSEGLKLTRCDCEPCRMSATMCPADETGHIMAFAELWDSINAKRAPWSSNPWVWVVGFKRVGTP
jgi:hypothetical protein